MTIPYKTDFDLRINCDKEWSAWYSRLTPQAAIYATAPRYFMYPGEPYSCYDAMRFEDLYIDATVKPLGMIAREIAEQRTEMVAADLGGDPMTQSLREKVARALYAEAFPESPSDADVCHLGWLDAADAAIQVCKEHFAGVADRAELNTADDAPSAGNAIRAEDGK